MGWIKRTADEPVNEHKCKVPMTTKPAPLPPPGVLSPNSPLATGEVVLPAIIVVDGAVGDIWACDSCGQVWQISQDTEVRQYGRRWYGEPEWRHVSRRLQRKYHPTYTCGCKVGQPVRSRCANNRGPGMVTMHGHFRPTVYRSASEIDSSAPDD